ncbi:MAG: tetratricopeptide repeat protein [Synergistaceae bacterium]|nr:tetratricopeptide repeat protein [Synergistaceae bacterium]
MRIKFLRLLLIVMLLSFAYESFAASPNIIENDQPHVGEQVVLSVETSQIPSNGSVEWSVSPTTGLNPDRILLRAGGRECAFTPLDTEPVRVIASFVDRNGNVISSTEKLITPKEFQIDVAVVIERPLTLWNASKRSDYVLSAEVLMAASPIRVRASLNPPFKGQHKFTWVSDAATAIMSQDNDDIIIRRGTIGESEISVTAFNASGTKLGSGEGKVSITLPVSAYNDSNNDREAWQSWQRAQALWESKNYSEAVELAKRASNLSPRDSEISEGLRAMNTNYARFTKAQKLRNDAEVFDSKNQFEDALRNLRAAQVIWPLDDGAETIQIEEERVNHQRLIQQQANWLRDTASAYDNENMYEEALEYYAKSIAVMSSDAVSDRIERIRNRLTLIADADRYAGEGNSLEREGKLEEALNRYGASVQSNPDATLRQHIEELQSVIQRRERQANALYREGRDLQRRNNNQEALKRYRESMNVWENDNARQGIQQLRNTRLAPDTVIRGPEDFGIGTRIDAQKIMQEADELYAQGNLNGAAALYRKALAISPSDEMRKWVAKLDDAIKERDSVIAANKQISEANALFKAGKKKEALDLYRQSLNTHKNAEIEDFIRRQGNTK